MDKIMYAQAFEKQNNVAQIRPLYLKSQKVAQKMAKKSRDMTESWFEPTYPKIILCHVSKQMAAACMDISIAL